MDVVLREEAAAKNHGIMRVRVTPASLSVTEEEARRQPEERRCQAARQKAATLERRREECGDEFYRRQHGPETGAREAADPTAVNLNLRPGPPGGAGQMHDSHR